MSLLNVLRSAVKVADTVTKPIQAIVSYQRDLGSDEYGDKTLGSIVKMHAIVDWKQRQVRTPSGLLSMSRATVTFLNIDEVNQATNGQGFNDEDIIILPDGTSGPILDMSGFIDAGTGHPLATEIFLG